MREYLPLEEIRILIEQCRDQAEKERSECRQGSWYRYIEQVAEQIGDAQLFEEIRKTSRGRLNGKSCLDIGRVYLQSGYPQAALAWLERIDDDDFFQESERDQLDYSRAMVLYEKAAKMYPDEQLFQAGVAACSPRKEG